MWYQTAMMRSILGSAASQRIIDYVSPIYGYSYYGLWLFNVIGMELDEVITKAEEVYDQIFPDSVTWAIPNWEKEYGITDFENMSEAQRRQQIAIKRQKRSMNPVRMENILEAMSGVEVEVTENVAKNTFLVTFLSALSDSELERMTEIIDSMKPAHLLCKIEMPGVMEVEQFDAYYRMIESEQENEVILIKEEE